MKFVRRVLVVAFVLGALAPLPARAQQQEPPPLEDVTLRGRILRADGQPLANHPVRVDARNGVSGFAVFGAIFTGGLSLFSCVAGPNELCPLPNSKSWESTTDGNGAYSFTFANAHRQGEQTNTDYFLRVAAPSAARPNQVVLASYELELWDAVHDAPDMTMWDPVVKVRARERAYEFAYDRRARSSNDLRLNSDDKRTNLRVTNGNSVEARELEDASVTALATAAKDERSARTIYHQRFVAAPVPLKGTSVPLSRRAACTITRSDGSRVPGCPYTDGDLVTAAVADPNPCRFGVDGKQVETVDASSGQKTPCQLPVKEVTIDFGRSREVGEIRPRCGCTVATSTDGAAYRSVAAASYPTPIAARYVRITGSSLGGVAEMSAFGPWPDEVAATPLAPTEPTPTVPATAAPERFAAPVPVAPKSSESRHWFPALLALAGLMAVSVQLGRREDELRRLWAGLRKNGFVAALSAQAATRRSGRVVDE